jgi:hypothetical protein
MMPTDAAVRAVWFAMLIAFGKLMLILIAVLAVLVVLAACLTMGDED